MAGEGGAAAGATRTNLLAAGVITGLGVAAMHYLGMAGIRFQGHLLYSVPIVVLSVVIALVAATAALWAAVSVRGFLASLGASLVMGIAVTGMHYTGMAAIHVPVQDRSAAALGPSPRSLLFPMLIGPVVFLLIAGVVVMFDPLLILGEGEWSQSTTTVPEQGHTAVRSQEPDTGFGNAFGVQNSRRWNDE